jgi:sec-independent protein translocase protein TatA
MSLLSLNPQLLLSMPSGGEWITILIVVIVLFGGKKIPELAKGIGKGIREFNDAKEGVKNEIEAGMKDKEKPSSTTNNA